MESSILKSVKKTLGLAPGYTAFDEDVVMHINTVLSDLNQLGVGPNGGFEIESDAQNWADFLGTDKRLNNVKTYVNLRVRLMFDPPATSFAIDSMQSQIDKLEWRVLHEVEIST